MKILLAVDGSEYSQAAADETAKRIWSEGSELKIISVIEPTVFAATPLGLSPYGVAPLYSEDVVNINSKKASEAVEDARARIEKGVTKSLKITTETFDGSPKKVIVEEAERWGADLIIVGSHGYGWWERVLLGSVSQAIVHHAPCSVEVVRVRQ